MQPTRSQWWTRKLLLLANVSAPVALLATGFRYPVLMVAAGLVHSAFACAVMRPQCGWLGPVATRFQPRGREVWLTIDDGPVEDSAALAEEMRRRGVRATFFVKGCNVLQHSAIARKVVDAGHSLANHTHTHPAAFFAWLTPARLRREIDECNAALRTAGIAATRWFRSPVGLKHSRLHPALIDRGMRMISWSIRGNDGIRCEPEAVARRVAERAEPGAIVLLHEGRARSNETVLRVVDTLLAQGFSFVIPEDEQLV